MRARLLQLRPGTKHSSGTKVSSLQSLRFCTHSAGIKGAMAPSSMAAGAGWSPAVAAAKLQDCLHGLFGMGVPQSFGDFLRVLEESLSPKGGSMRAPPCQGPCELVCLGPLSCQLGPKLAGVRGASLFPRHTMVHGLTKRSHAATHAPGFCLRMSWVVGVWGSRVSFPLARFATCCITALSKSDLHMDELRQLAGMARTLVVVSQTQRSCLGHIIMSSPSASHQRSYVMGEHVHTCGVRATMHVHHFAGLGPQLP